MPTIETSYPAFLRRAAAIDLCAAYGVSAATFQALLTADAVRPVYFAPKTRAYYRRDDLLTVLSHQKHHTQTNDKTSNDSN